MEFVKSAEKCSIPYGVYHLDHGYINMLRTADRNVIAPEICDIYCGPVYHSECKRGIVGLFAPIDVKKFNSEAIAVGLFEKGVYADIIDFKRMLPVVNKRVLTSADEDERITAFCIDSQNIFETCADAIIEAQKNKTGCPRMMFT